MSIVSGTIGAVMGSEATTEAANTTANAQRDATAQQIELQKEMYDQYRKDFAPYQQAGYYGIGQLYGQTTTYTDPVTGEQRTVQGAGYPFSFTTDPYTGEILKPPSYDNTVTNELGNYKQSEGYQAQNSLAQQALQRQLNARGLNYGATGASAAAELSQKLTASDYDKYRQDLQQRYQGLSTDFSQLMGVNQNEYNRLLDATKIGQGAAASAGQAGNSYAQQASSALQNMANATGQAATAAGQAQAGLWSGLGTASANTFGTALRAYDYGSTQGWWGSGGAGYSSLADYEAAGGAVGEGEAYMAML